MFIVYVSIKAGNTGETYYCEYSGKKHKSFINARNEELKALKDNRVIYTRIKEV